MLNKAAAILQTFSVESVELLKKYHIEAGQRTTGKTLAAFGFKLTQEPLSVSSEIYGAAYIKVLDDGRPRTSGSGTGALYGIIKQWIIDKGTFQYATESELNGLAYVITRKIHQSGTFQYRNNGTTFSGFSKPISAAFTEQRIKQLEDHLGIVLAPEVTSEILKEYMK